MKNTLGDLNLHLFEQLERLNDDELKGEALKEEMDRSKAMASIAGMIIENASLVLRAQKTYNEQMPCDAELPKMLSGGE